MAIIQARPQNESQERRDEVVKATWRVIAREGLDRASMRAIAQELFTSTGVITHYFRDKDQMLDFALSSMAESLETARAPLMKGPISVEQVLEHLARVLPRTPLRVDWWRVWMSFAVAAFNRRRQGLDHAIFYAETRKIWTGILRRLLEARPHPRRHRSGARSGGAALPVRRPGRARRDRSHTTQCEAPTRHPHSLLREAGSLIRGQRGLMVS